MTEPAASPPVETARPPGLVLVLDALDAPLIADFWATALRYDRQRALGPFEVLTPPQAGDAPALLVQAVDEPRQGKNRMHLDLHVPDMQAEAQRLVELGATRLGEDSLGQIEWIRMADPEGNEFDIATD